ncbi:type IV pilin protein [Halomonas sp. H5]|uniref:type IV pilin protein n=1 Tax=Halomonas sp. H5 TaxID=3423910 RepID=UPI003D3694C5
MRAGEQATTRPGGRRRQAGFTLIEVMIAVAVVAILAAIAYPSYIRYVTESRRTEAKAILMETAGRLERCYTVTSDYRYRDAANNACVSFPVDSENEFYGVTAALDASTYTLSAAPKNGQERDTECGTFTLTQTGARGAGDSDCW